MIRSFKDPKTEQVFNGEAPKGFPAELLRVSRRKLGMVDATVVLTDLRVPPRNLLEALKGDRAGQHSIRINDQFRVCFIWRDGSAYDVEITDYH